MGQLVVVNRRSFGVGFKARVVMKIQTVEQLTIGAAKHVCGEREKDASDQNEWQRNS